jgi:hypothetical protein
MKFKFNNTQFDLEDFSNEIVIINTSTGSYFTISGSAVTILRWFYSPITIEHATQLIDKTFPNEDSEASTFMEWLKTQGLIHESETSEASLDEINPVPESNPIIFNEWTYTRFDDMSDLIRLDPIHDVSEKGWPHRKSND